MAPGVCGNEMQAVTGDGKWLGSEMDLSVLRGRRRTGDSDDDSGVFCWEWEDPQIRRRRDTWP